jgi:fibrillarin-like pre-rRNA processing protein
MQTLFVGVYKVDERTFATKNAVPGKRVYDERQMRSEIGELRIWDPFKSKLAGAIRKGLKNFPFTPGSKVLYLGASTGTTISHLSDIMGKESEIFSVEIAAQCMKSLLAMCEKRENVIPIQADANHPQEYAEVGKVDSVYMDVAQPNQAEILIKNADMFLKKDGIAMIAIKSQSIDVTKKPREVFEIVLKELDAKFEILETYELEPFDKDHLFVVLKYK